MIEREQHLLAAAGPEHQHLRFLQQVVRKRGRRVIEVSERPQIARELRDRAERVRVREDPELRRRLGDVVEREPGRVAERDRRALHHGDEAERARALLDDPGVGHEQRRRQALVLRNVRMKRDEPGRQPQARSRPQRQASEAMTGRARAMRLSDKRQRGSEKASRGDQAQRGGRREGE